MDGPTQEDPIQENPPEAITADYLEAAFHTHYEGLYRYAYTLLQDSDKARDAVQQIFTNIWEQKDHIRITISFRAYLYRALYNYSVNLKTRGGPPPLPLPDDVQETHFSPTELAIECKELQELIDRSIEELPPQCRTIFLKTRMEGKTYADIAREQEISVKTVEAQVSKALKILRKIVFFHQKT